MPKKQCELSEFERGLIVGARATGLTEQEIGEMHSFAKSTVHDVLHNFNEGWTTPQPRSEGPSKLNDHDKRHLIQDVKKNRTASLSKIAAQMDNVSTSTIPSTLHSEGYFGCIAVRKPFISNINCCKQLTWAHERLKWKNKWDFIIWSDKSKFELSQNK